MWADRSSNLQRRPYQLESVPVVLLVHACTCSTCDCVSMAEQQGGFAGRIAAQCRPCCTRLLHRACIHTGVQIVCWLLLESVSLLNCHNWEVCEGAVVCISFVSELPRVRRGTRAFNHIGSAVLLRSCMQVHFHMPQAVWLVSPEFSLVQFSHVCNWCAAQRSLSFWNWCAGQSSLSRFSTCVQDGY